MARIALVHDEAGVAATQAPILRSAGHDVDHLRLPDFGASWGRLAAAFTTFSFSSRPSFWSTPASRRAFGDRGLIHQGGSRQVDAAQRRASHSRSVDGARLTR